MITTDRRRFYRPGFGYFACYGQAGGFHPGRIGNPTVYTYGWTFGQHYVLERKASQVEAFLGHPECPLQCPEAQVVLPPYCPCCGEEFYVQYTVVRHTDPLKCEYRCWTHREKNPCAVEGCARVRKANGNFGNDQWLCSEHWRMACPPRSTTRRIYHRIFRDVKKRGGKWSMADERRFYRVWNAIVRKARSMSAGDIDMDEINKLFGWAQ